MNLSFLKLKFITTKLFDYNNEKLNAFSIILIILLDIFIFSIIENGITTEKFKSPPVEVVYPYECQTYFEKDLKDYSDFNEVNYYTDGFGNGVSPICVDLLKELKTFSSSDPFKNNAQQIIDLKSKEADIAVSIANIQNTYDTKLFEKMASESVGDTLQETKSKYYDLLKEQATLKKALESIPAITSLGGYEALVSYIKAHKAEFEKNYASYAFWQSFYAFGWMLVYVVPLFLVAFFFYQKSSKMLIKLISSHIIAILTVLFLIDLSILIWSVLPKTFLKKIVDLLYSLGLMQLYYYFLIIAAVVIVGYVIYLVQKYSARVKLEARKNGIKKTIANSLCPECGFRVDYTKPFCPNCANRLWKECPKCGENTINGLPFCNNCGEEISS
ncbi:double zinc ribbon domain-containing protein [Sulfuricurvum sp.]|uniref:double zinc ribbon domain-containing protein n=1 Tax=Sulfuricurvum sp. TaxID=2025608 RepID=UPI002D3E6EBD|nr:zinc ribbon domain-containing protein [Sulfuricurvum sp.]HZF71439.1 zinc ribbon domain-containing protein [Sulfuricurvum sp.]